MAKAPDRAGPLRGGLEVRTSVRWEEQESGQAHCANSPDFAGPRRVFRFSAVPAARPCGVFDSRNGFGTRHGSGLRIPESGPNAADAHSRSPKRRDDAPSWRFASAKPSVAGVAGPRTRRKMRARSVFAGFRDPRTRPGRVGASPACCPGTARRVPLLAPELPRCVILVVDRAAVGGLVSNPASRGQRSVLPGELEPVAPTAGVVTCRFLPRTVRRSGCSVPLDIISP